MSNFVKGELEIVQVSLSTYQIWAKPKPNRKAVLVARSLNEDDAKELVRRWNAFEDGGLVDELRTACEKVQGWLDTSSLQQVLVHYTEDERRHALIMGIATNLERLEAALAKS